MAYLPGATKDRIKELREKKGWKRHELAEMISVSPSTVGRIESGQTKTVSDETLQSLAQVFHVSTDFLLGITDVPDRKNYDIGELGLSAQAARNLYSGKVNAEVVNRMLENPRFATLTQMIAQYFSETFAAGIAAQNQIFSSLSSILLGYGRNHPEEQPAAKEAARAVGLEKVPVYQPDLTTIQNTFMTMLKEIKRDMESGLEAPKALSKEVTEKLMGELEENQEDFSLRSITPEQIAGAITGMLDGVGGVDTERLDALRAALIPLFQKPIQGMDDGSTDE